jgi:phosphohistidine phosphatase SixA
MSLRQLILLRHAHAEPQAAGQTDVERVLSPRGEAEPTMPLPGCKAMRYRNVLWSRPHAVRNRRWHGWSR